MKFINKKTLGVAGLVVLGTIAGILFYRDTRGSKIEITENINTPDVLVGSDVEKVDKNYIKNISVSNLLDGEYVIESAVQSEYLPEYMGTEPGLSLKTSSEVRISSSTEDSISYIVETNGPRVAGSIAGVAYRVVSNTLKTYESNENKGEGDSMCRVQIFFPDDKHLRYDIESMGDASDRQGLFMPACSSYEGAGGGSFMNGAVHQKK